MKLENQVCTPQQAKRLDELGVNAPSEFLWYKANNWYVVGFNDGIGFASTYINAYCVAELGVMFGVGTRVTDWLVNVKIDTSTKTLMWRPEFLADCLIEALETGLTTAAEVNERLNQN